MCTDSCLQPFTKFFMTVVNLHFFPLDLFKLSMILKKLKEYKTHLKVMMTALKSLFTPEPQPSRLSFDLQKILDV